MPVGLCVPSKKPIPAASTNAVPPPEEADVAGLAECVGPGLCVAGSLAMAVTTGAGSWSALLLLLVPFPRRLGRAGAAKAPWSSRRLATGIIDELGKKENERIPAVTASAKVNPHRYQ